MKRFRVKTIDPDLFLNNGSSFESELDFGFKYILLISNLVPKRKSGLGSETGSTYRTKN